MTKVTRPDLAEWPDVLRVNGRLIVTGKHGVLWTQRLVARLRFPVTAALVALPLVAIARSDGWMARILSLAGIVAAAFGFDDEASAVVLGLLLHALPSLLFVLLTSNWMTFHVLSPTLYRRTLSVEFSAEGVRVTAGRAASAHLYRWADGVIAFRVSDHPRAKRTKRVASKLNPWLEAGRVEFYVGERSVVLADMAMREQAARFVGNCQVAAKEMRPKRMVTTDSEMRSVGPRSQQPLAGSRKVPFQRVE